jgi:ankyrin repeat protein
MLKNYIELTALSVVSFLILVTAKVCADGIFETSVLMDPDKVHRIIAESPELVHARDEWGRTPLSWAAEIGLTETVKLLISNGADAKSRDNRGETPLHEACLSGRKEIAELLISKGADVNAKDKRGQAPLHFVAERENKKIEAGRKEVAQVLIAHGADVNAKDSSGRTPLHDASARGLYDLAIFLISNGANTNARDNDGDTPLFCCVWYFNNTKIAGLLLAEGANINARNKQGKTVLKDAIEKGKTEMFIDLLRKHGAKE